MQRIGSAVFDADFMTVQRDDGLVVRLTRTERLLLRYMVARPGWLLTRNQLLDAVSEPGTDKNDRTIDFAVTRLRAKLNDSATNPTFIATRYGEGYIWIARERPVHEPVAGAWLMVGPVRRLGRAAEEVVAGADFGERLRAALAERFAGRQIALDAECPGPGEFGDRPPVFNVEVTTVAREGAEVDAVLSLAEFASGRIIHVHRAGINRAEAAGEMAALVADRIWHDQLHQPVPRQPMVVSLSNAGLTLTGDPSNWSENDARLREMLARSPDDPVLRLLHATSLQSRHVIAGPAYFLGPVDVDADWREVEEIVTSVLPQVQDDPVQCMSAARCLFFVGPAYRPLAIEMAERAHREGAALAASYGTIGQIRACLGDIDAGIEAYDIALGMTEPGSQYDLYLLVLKAQAQLAANLREDLGQTLAVAYGRRPEMAGFMEVLCAAPNAPSEMARMAVGAMPPAMGTAMLRFLYHSCTRSFIRPEHRLNTIEGTVRLCVGQFGAGVMPEELLPEFGHLAGRNADTGMEKTSG
jgi:DNA-binding winged helix-turn-helix (wHTH) protein